MSQPKPKAPPPRRSGAAKAAAQNTNNEELLRGPTVRAALTQPKPKQEAPPAQPMISSFTAPARENAGRVGGRNGAAGGNGGGGGGGGGARTKSQQTSTSSMSLLASADLLTGVGHEASYNAHLHYHPITLPFAPPNPETETWYEGFMGGLEGLDGDFQESVTTAAEIKRSTQKQTMNDDEDGETVPGNIVQRKSLDLPAYKDPSLLAATTGTGFGEENDGIKAEISGVDEDDVNSSLTFTNPNSPAYMNPTLHSCSNYVAYKSDTELQRQQLLTGSDQHVNDNFVLLQVPPIVHLGMQRQTTTTTQNGSTVTSSSVTSTTTTTSTPLTNVSQPSPPQSTSSISNPTSYNVNGSTLKAEDAGKLGLIPRFRELSLNGCVGYLERYSSGVTYLCLTNPANGEDYRLLLQSGGDVNMRQDLCLIRPIDETDSLIDTNPTKMSTKDAMTDLITQSTNPNQKPGYTLYNAGHLNQFIVASVDVDNLLKNKISKA